MSPRRRAAQPNNPVASSLFKSHFLKPIHLNQVKEDRESGNEEKDGKKDVEMASLKKNVEKRRMKNEAQSNYFLNDSYCASSKLQSPFERRSAPERTNSQPEPIGGAGTDTLPSFPEIPNISTSQKYQVSDRLQPHRSADHEQHSQNIPKLTPLTQAKLTHTRQTGHSKASISARTKDLRLKGADIYVARLGHDCKACHSPTLPQPPRPSPSPAIPSHSSPKSLHDELRLSAPSAPSNPSHASTVATSSTTTKPQIRASRPCHRCITHMHAAGIARAFWTNAQGEWEGAKVRDLMDALEGGSSSGSGEGEDGKGKDAGVFVTKHEVLMLRRVMGC